MTTEELVGWLGKGGFAGALLGLIYLVGMRLIAAIDRIGVKVDDHTKTDVTAHSEVKAGLAALTAKIDTQKAVEGAVEAIADEISGVHEAPEQPRRTPPFGSRRLGTRG